MATATTAVNACDELNSAIDRIQNMPTDPHALATAARSLTRQADEAELTALETSDRSERAQLLRRVQAARVAAHTARQSARRHALNTSRTSLLENGKDELATASTTTTSSSSAKSSASNASRIAKDINETLRRTTATVSDEVNRSRAAGDVLQDSTSKLIKTKDQHVTLSSGIGKGRRTLNKIKTSETIANIVVGLSFLFFFSVTLYIVNKRIRSSLVASVIIRPTASVIRLPFSAIFRTAKWGMKQKRRSSNIHTSDDIGDSEKVEWKKLSPDIDEDIPVKSGKQESSDIDTSSTSESTMPDSEDDSHVEKEFEKDLSKDLEKDKAPETTFITKPSATSKQRTVQTETSDNSAVEDTSKDEL